MLFFTKQVDADLLEFLEQVVGLQQAQVNHPEPEQTLFLMTSEGAGQPPQPPLDLQRPDANRDTLQELLEEYYKFAALAGVLVNDIADNLFQDSDFNGLGDE